MSNEKIRTIKTGKVKLQSFSDAEIAHDPIRWLTQKAKPGMLLLAHGDDGAIWGKAVTQDNVHASFQFPLATLLPQAELRAETLNMAWLFDTSEEIFLWRVAETQWQARAIQDNEGEPASFFDEAQILWGTTVEARDSDFVRATEGAQGLRHAPPVELWQESTGSHPLRLYVRHYLQEEDGWLRITFSRLIKQAAKETCA